jgi:glucose-1-phosphate adenylyltransferase
MPSLNDILAVILGGGRGARLYPLTQMRSKPAVPIAGKYRLIDIPISNCINSEIYRIAVLTQFNSVSLHRHITHTYNFDAFHTGWVQIWAAEQTVESADWYQGTADAVRKQTLEIQSSGAKNVLILAGDHLYRMDYKAMAEYHWANKADITVAVQPVPREDAPRFGILKREQDGRITSFVEKPKDAETQNKFISRDDPERPFLGSMGIYMFKTRVLMELLTNFPSYHDFGSDIIPQAIKTCSVFGFDFNGYWQDIGTIRSFYETNLALTTPQAPFNFYDPKLPIYTDTRFLPGSIIEDSKLCDVLISDGSRILRSDISHSIIGTRSQVSAGCTIKDTIMMGSDYYERDDEGLPIGIGANSYIEGAILDKNVRIGSNVIIRPFSRNVDLDNEKWYVRDGIVVIPKDAEIPDGTHIEPK